MSLAYRHLAGQGIDRTIGGSASACRLRFWCTYVLIFWLYLAYVWAIFRLSLSYVFFIYFAPAKALELFAWVRPKPRLGTVIVVACPGCPHRRWCGWWCSGCGCGCWCWTSPARSYTRLIDGSTDVQELVRRAFGIADGIKPVGHNHRGQNYKGLWHRWWHQTKTHKAQNLLACSVWRHGAVSDVTTAAAHMRAMWRSTQEP